MAVSPATATDLTNRSLRALSERELVVGGQLLADAFAVLVAHKPNLDARLDGNTEPNLAGLVKQVQCAMVLRVLNNPSGKLEEAVDDYRYRLDAAVSSGALYVSDAELALIGDGPGTSAGGAWSIRPRVEYVNGYWASSDVWVPYA